MITSFYNGNRGQLMPILNANRITEDKKKEAIKAMGMSACQASSL